MYTILFIAAGGGFGALCRYGVTVFMQSAFGESLRIPLATVIVNLLGSFLFALIWMTVREGRGGALQDERVQKALLVGFLGSFTTFSTFAFETTRLFEQGHTWMATGNFLLQNVLGLVCVVLGFTVARSIAG